MKKMLVLLILGLCSLSVFSQPKGHIFAIGGGFRSSEMMNRYIELAGGKNAHIVVLPMASEVMEESAAEHIDQFKQLGCTNVEVMIFTKETADDPANFAKLKDVTGVFFGGGDQVKLTGVLLGTKLFDRIKEIYNNGGAIGGTSAGAAVMSEVMITGEELVNKDSTRSFAIFEKGNVEVKKGFGFVTKAVVDQHFLIRKRYNRILTVLLEHPNLPCVAIDEATAILVNPDETFEVVGDSQVLVFDATKAKNIHTDAKGKLAGTDITLHALLQGDRFDLKTRTVIK